MPGNRGWCFTINNWTEEELEHIKSLRTNVNYIIVGRENAPTTGTPHLQGYIWLKNGRDMDQIKNMFRCTRMNLRVAKGTAAQNFIYCTKEDKEAYEFGTPPKQGKRNDLVGIRNELLGGANLRDVARTCDDYQQLRYAESMARYAPLELREKPHVIWYWGPTGTGKTRRAWADCLARYELDDIWVSMEDLKWWEGYSGQKAVIFDDLRYGSAPFVSLLRYFDRYPVRVPFKCGSCPLKAELIIVTCAHKPEEFPDGIENIAQLLRRLDVVEEMSEPWEPPVPEETQTVEEEDDATPIEVLFTPGARRYVLDEEERQRILADEEIEGRAIPRLRRENAIRIETDIMEIE